MNVNDDDDVGALSQHIIAGFPGHSTVTVFAAVSKVMCLLAISQGLTREDFLRGVAGAYDICARSPVRLKLEKAGAP